MASIPGGAASGAAPGSLLADPSIAPDWAEVLGELVPELSLIERFLAREAAAGRTTLPEHDRIFAAFRAPLSRVRVLIVGQDPYPTPGHAIGLSFAVDRMVLPLPRSLQNISRELVDDLGVAPLPHGDLGAWSDAGVLLLNRVLTVSAGDAGSHRKRGWETVTEHAIRALVARGGPLVAILWGNDAQKLEPLLAGIPVISSAHPSPLSARRGFFGSRPFSRANEALVAQGAEPIDWQIRG